MKQILLMASFVLLSMGANAQIGINAGEAPKGTLEVGYDTEWAKSNKAQGITPPKLTTEQRNAMKDIHEGLMIYNTTVHCLQVFNGRAWTCTDGSNKEIPPVVDGATATLETKPLRWVALEHNGIYYSYPKDGIVPNESITVEIPYSNATNGDYSAYEKAFTLPDRNNTPQLFRLSYPAGSISNATGVITATLTNVSGVTYEPPLYPADGQWQDLATPQVTFNGANAKALKIQATGGVADRCLGKTTQDCVSYGTNEKEHQFIYVPITGSDGKTWLNNNLGADYANVNSPVFDPTQQATSPTDYHAYGSLFQWQRNPDGHELINWSSSSNGSPKYSGTGSLSNSWTNADTNKFIPYNSYSYGWVNNSLNQSGPYNLWESGGATNPCPDGYHVPTTDEQFALYNAIGSGSNVWNDQVLRLSASGYRISGNTTLYGQSSGGSYWSSSKYSSKDSWYLYFYSSDSGGKYFYRAFGLGVRCIKD